MACEEFTSRGYLSFFHLPSCAVADEFLLYGGYGVEPPGLVIFCGIGVLNYARLTATGPFKLSAPGPGVGSWAFQGGYGYGRISAPFD